MKRERTFWWILTGLFAVTMTWRLATGAATGLVIWQLVCERKDGDGRNDGD
jgi:hypothetical protein